jgi:hypothetical protein
VALGVFFTRTASRWLLSIVGIGCSFLHFVLKVIERKQERELGTP